MGKDEDNEAAVKEARKIAQKLRFSAQLATGTEVKQISNFLTLKELYVRISEAFSIPAEDIVFCTLNSPSPSDMDHLLGGQLAYDDLIYVHLRGEPKTVKATKTKPTIGLSITDNCAGYPFIKRVYPDSLLAGVKEIELGDVIANVNGQSMVGKKHSDVAEALKSIPVGGPLMLGLFGIRKAQGNAPTGARRHQSKAQTMGRNKCKYGTMRLRDSVTQADPSMFQAETESAPAPAPATSAKKEDIENAQQAEATKKIMELLESFMGVPDEEMAAFVYEIATEAEDKDAFLKHVRTQMGDFGFPDDLIGDVWHIVYGGEAVAVT
eukprot:Opistho-1_new@6578